MIPFTTKNSAVKHVQVQVGKVVNGTVYNYSQPVHVLQHQVIALSLNHINSNTVRVSWDLKAQFVNGSLTIMPAFYDANMLDYDDRYNFNISNSVGMIHFTIQNKYILYQALIKATFYGIEKVKAESWYLTDDKIVDKFWLRYLLMVSTSFMAIAVLWLCIIIRTKMINNLITRTDTKPAPTMSTGI